MKQRNVLVQIGLFDQRLLLGVSRFAKNHHWHLTVDDRFSLPYGWDGDGAIVLLNDRADLLSFVTRLKAPVVDLGLYYPKKMIPRVVGDCEAIGRLAAEHFAGRFYQDIAWFSTVWSNVHRLRFKGLCDNWPGHPPLRWVWSENAGKNKLNKWGAMMRWLVNNIWQSPKPLAVLAFDDYDAARIQDACASADIKVPDEVAIMGVDNCELIDENRFVPLASIRHDFEGIGFCGAELLHHLMNGGRPPAAPRMVPPRGIALRQSADYFAVPNPLVRAALLYIRKRLDKSIGADEIAAHLQVSRATLDRKIKSSLGHSLGAEILAHRVVQAKLLLTNTTLTAQQISRETGFCDAPHMTKTFIKFTGMSPIRFRKRHQAAVRSD
ncbi:MAG: substrate-binding domain-containing protein [Kiritimatiellae bacterium]|nr:substrate-binding domain-containing protein [Kiritimatiellia bacterium]